MACLGLELILVGARLCLGDPEVRTRVVCPIVDPWSPAEQRRLAAEIRSLPSGSATAALAGRHIRLRDQIRAVCPQP